MVQSQLSKQHLLCKDPVIAGVSMFKDEEDIVYQNLLWHYTQGIKRFVLLDNRSSDNTADEIRRFANNYPDACVYLIEDREIGYYQSRKITAVAEFAHSMWGAEWIFPFDADEFLCSYRAPLDSVLQTLGKEHLCIRFPYQGYILRSFYENSEPNPVKRITHRLTGNINQGTKVMVRWQAGMTIAQGNHDLYLNDQLIPASVNGEDIGLVLKHYAFRSKEHIRRKIINGGKAYKAAISLSAETGISWKTWDNEYQSRGEAYIEESYQSLCNSPADAIYDPLII